MVRLAEGLRFRFVAAVAASDGVGVSSSMISPDMMGWEEGECVMCERKKGSTGGTGCGPDVSAQLVHRDALTRLPQMPPSCANNPLDYPT